VAIKSELSKEEPCLETTFNKNNSNTAQVWVAYLTKPWNYGVPSIENSLFRDQH